MKEIVQTLLAVFAILIPRLKREDSKEGIKEVKEAVIGVNEVALFTSEKLQDGMQAQDAIDFYTKITQDEDFKKVIMDAYDKKEKIPAEVKDVDAGEGLELASVQLEYVPKYVEIFGKK